MLRLNFFGKMYSYNKISGANLSDDRKFFDIFINFLKWLFKKKKKK